MQFIIYVLRSHLNNYPSQGQLALDIMSVVLLAQFAILSPLRGKGGVPEFILWKMSLYALLIKGFKTEL